MARQFWPLRLLGWPSAQSNHWTVLLAWGQNHSPGAFSLWRSWVAVVRRTEWGTWGTTYVSESSQPELSELSHVSDAQQLRLQPVVDSCGGKVGLLSSYVRPLPSTLTWTVKLGHPGLVEAAEDVSVVPGDQLVLGQPEAAAASSALVETPAVWTVEGGLG